jgi:hypothetical protein
MKHTQQIPRCGTTRNTDRRGTNGRLECRMYFFPLPRYVPSRKNEYSFARARGHHATTPAPPQPHLISFFGRGDFHFCRRARIQFICTPWLHTHSRGSNFFGYAGASLITGTDQFFLQRGGTESHTPPPPFYCASRHHVVKSRFSFVSNDPTHSVDPAGRSPCLCRRPSPRRLLWWFMSYLTLARC